MLWRLSLEVAVSNLHVRIQLSQYKLGESYYRGTQSWQRDCSEALKWLQKAAKHPTPEPSIRGAAAVRNKTHSRAPISYLNEEFVIVVVLEFCSNL